MMNNLVVKVINKKGVVDSLQLTQGTNHALNAIDNVNYLIIDKLTKSSPNQLKMFRRGDDLYINFTDNELLILDYYQAENSNIIGFNNGSYHYYDYNSLNQATVVNNLADNQSSWQYLGNEVENMTWWENGSSVSSNGAGSNWGKGLLSGLGALGAIGAGVALVGGSKSKSDNQDTDDNNKNPNDNKTDVKDINENYQPANIDLTNNEIAENAKGAIIGTLTNDSHIYTVSDKRFEVVDGKLKLKNNVSLDYEKEPTVKLTITTDDGNGGRYSKTLLIDVKDINENHKPTNIDLTNNTIAENAKGVIIGKLTTSDMDKNDSHIYTVSDKRFEVVNGKLKLKNGISLDYEKESTIKLTITTDDGNGGRYSKTLLIDVKDINENHKPTNIDLTNNEIAENAKGVIIGTLTTSDLDKNDSHIYTVNDKRFEVVNGNLKLKNGVSLDYEKEPTVKLTITTDDGNDGRYSKTLLIYVKDIKDTQLELTGIEDLFPNVLMSQFANVAYLGNEGDKKLLTEKEWQFLNHKQLNIDSKYFGNDDSIYFENGGMSLQNGKWVETHSHGKESKDTIFGSAGAVVAERGDSLVLSFRGTEDIKAIGKDGEVTFAPVVRSAINMILQEKYGKNLHDDLATISDKQLTEVADELCELAIQSFPFIMEKLAQAIDFFTDIRENIIKKFVEWSKISYDELPDTDSAGWIAQESYYNKFSDLLTAVQNYATDKTNGIKKIYVTGHSLGATMASWFLSDTENGAMSDKFANIEFIGMPYATAGIVDFKEHKTNATVYRPEVAKDLTPDITDIFADGVKELSKSNILSKLKITQLGEQYNIVTNSEFSAYKEEFLAYKSGAKGPLHNMDNYKVVAEYLEEVGFNQDTQFLHERTNVFHKGLGREVAPILSDYQNWADYQQENFNKLTDDEVNNFVKDSDKGAIIQGDYTSKIKKAFDWNEWMKAESYSEHDIIIGTKNDDKLIGDKDGSVLGTNDIFYIGGGNDIVYGHQKGDDDGGIDTVVYKFADTLLAQGNIKSASLKGDSNQDSWYWHDMNKVTLDIDGSADKLTDIEQLHFVDSASDAINLLAGAKNDDTIKGMGGDDYLFGSEGDDKFIENKNSGNDRIHGGKGNDTVVYNDVKLTDVAIENFTLKLSFDDGSTDTLYSVENIVIDGKESKTSELIKDNLNLTINDLLDVYKPIINYKGNDHDNLRVYGDVTKNKDGGYSLDYELREDDTFSPDDHWWLHIELGDDLLPTYFYTETGGLLADHTVQVRNVFDTSLTHQDNHVETFAFLGNKGLGNPDSNDAMYLTPEIKASDVLSDYSVRTKGIQHNDWDWDDYVNVGDGQSNNYDIRKLGELESGQMEMGFLFQDTNLAKLGHFDLVGQDMVL